MKRVFQKLWQVIRYPIGILRRNAPKEVRTCVLNTAAIDQARPVDAYIQIGNVVRRTDGQPISDKEVPYLIETGLQEAIRREQNSPFHRSPADQELIFRFTEKHGRQSSALTSQFESLDDAAYKSKDLQEKIKLLSEALEKYKVAKAWHYKISKGGMMYFQDMWERMHNSQNPCFSWDEDEKEYLLELLWERDKVRPTILTAAEDGFLQKEIYALFEPEKKSSVQRIIRSMEAEGLIARTKKSGTYWVTLS